MTIDDNAGALEVEPETAELWDGPSMERTI
jgi:hypothetical protein